MAAVVGCGSASISWVQSKDYSSKRNVRNRFRVSCVSSSAVSDPYKALRIHPGASESEVKKAFRQLALQAKFSFHVKYIYFLINKLKMCFLLTILKLHCHELVDFDLISVSSRCLQRKQLWRPISPN